MSSIFTVFIGNKDFSNPTIDPLVAASLAAQGVQWWETKPTSTQSLVNGKYTNEGPPLKLVDITLAAELPLSEGIYWIFRSKAKQTLP